MKKLLIIFSLAFFLSGCILLSSEKRELSKDSVPAVPVVATKQVSVDVSPSTKEPYRSNLTIHIGAGDEQNYRPYQWAEIYLDDAFIGSSDRLQLYLEPGQHKIAVKASGYKTYEKIITILPGKITQQMSVLLEKE